MSRLPFEAFLALRYLRPRRNFVSVITVISILGVLLGVMVLIVVISVMSGFDREWRDRILGFKAHLQVTHARGVIADYERAMSVISSNSHVTGVAPLITSQVWLKTQPQEGESRSLAPMLWGVDSEREASVSILPTNIVKGKFDFTHYGMVVGCDFAEGMNLDVGDKVAVYSSGLIQKLEQSRGQANIDGAMADEYTIRGIFDVGFGEYNSFVVVTSLEDARQMNLLPEGSSQALQVKLRDPFDADGVALELKAALGANYYVRTWKQADPKIFDALAVEKTMMFFLLFFIMIVAGFGIVNSQITFVVQKTAEIGILKSIGATNRQVLWLFLSQSVVVGVLGVGIGFGAALLALAYRNEFLFFLRRVTGIEILPSSVYGVYQLPAQIQTGDILVICGTAFLTFVLAGLFPAWKASRMQPVEALRYE